MRTMRRDEAGAIEPLFILLGILILFGVCALLIVFDLVWFAVAGVLFFFGALALLQGLPFRGWLGVIIGSVLLLIALVIGVVFLR